MSTPLRERPDAPLGTLIFRAGLLPAETIESALEEGVKTGKRLGEILTERGLLKEADLARLLAGQKGLPFVTLREQIVDPAAAGLFSEDQARLFRALPYAFEDGVPVVAIADPTDDVLTRNVREALGREDARFVVSVRSELADIVGEVYARGVPPAPPPASAAPSEAPSPADTTGSDPADVLSGPVPAPSAESDVGGASAESHFPAPPADAPAPEATAPAALTGSDPGHGSEGHVHVPAEPAVEATMGSDPGHGAQGHVASEHAENGAGEAPLPPAAADPGSAQPDAAPPPANEETPAPVARLQAVPEPGAPASPAAPFEAPPPPSAVEVPVAPVDPVVAPAAPAPPAAQAPHLLAPASSEPSSPQPEAAAAAEQAPADHIPAEPTEQAPAAPAEQEPAPEPVAQLAAPAPATPASATSRLTVRLANGERVEVGAYADLEAAKAAAKALMAEVAAADGGDWPFVNGRFLKPDTIVSVDIS